MFREYFCALDFCQFWLPLGHLEKQLWSCLENVESFINDKDKLQKCVLDVINIYSGNVIQKNIDNKLYWIPLQPRYWPKLGNPKTFINLKYIAAWHNLDNWKSHFDFLESA